MTVKFLQGGKGRLIRREGERRELQLTLEQGGVEGADRSRIYFKIHILGELCIYYIFGPISYIFLDTRIDHCNNKEHLMNAHCQ